MKRFLCSLLILAGAAAAQPLPNPPFTINRKITLAQVNRGGRVELMYDLRAYPGANLKVSCYRYQGPSGSQWVQDWTVSERQGKLKLDFTHFPSAQYVFRGTLINAQEQPLALAFRPVQLEYGGWTGRLRVDAATRAASDDSRAPLAGAAPVAGADSDYVFEVTPNALVVPQSQTSQLTATLNKRPMAEILEWKLEGPGKLSVIENFVGIYTAPKGARNGERATIHVWAPQHPRLRQSIQVLISSETVSTPQPQASESPAPGPTP